MDKCNELVSIIMPAYNSEKFIADSIESVINQSYIKWELLVINDNSSDKTKEIVEIYINKDARIKFYDLTVNFGVANARNIGLEHATGKYIAFLDSDDIWKSDKLLKQIKFMNENNVLFSFTSYEWIDRHGEKLNKIVSIPSKNISYKELMKVNYFGCLTVIFEKSLLNQLRFKQIKHEDYVLWLDILKENNCEATGINEILAYYRKAPNSVSSNKFKSLIWTWQIYRKHLGMNNRKSILHMFLYFIELVKKYW